MKRYFIKTEEEMIASGMTIVPRWVESGIYGHEIKEEVYQSLQKTSTTSLCSEQFVPAFEFDISIIISGLQIKIVDVENGQTNAETSDKDNFVVNTQVQKELLEAFQSKMSEIMLKKGDDYANSDRLSNFKVAGAIINLSPEKQALSMISTKVARLGNLIDGKDPHHESVQDSLIDLANYAALTFMLLEEKKNKQ